MTELAEIEGLEAKTQVELARWLGVARQRLSKWKDEGLRRGAPVPSGRVLGEWLAWLRQLGKSQIADAAEQRVRDLVEGKAEEGPAGDEQAQDEPQGMDLDPADWLLFGGVRIPKSCLLSTGTPSAASVKEWAEVQIQLEKLAAQRRQNQEAMRELLPQAAVGIFVDELLAAVLRMLSDLRQGTKGLDVVAGLLPQQRQALVTGMAAVERQVRSQAERRLKDRFVELCDPVAVLPGARR